MSLTLNLRDLLNQELAQRKERNPSYSLRAFSKALGVNVTALSMAMSNQRPLSKKKILKIASHLNLSTMQLARLLDDFGYEVDDQIENESFKEIDEADSFLLSDWYYMGILNLARLPNIPDDPVTIASRFNISETQAQEAIKKLKKAGLIHVEAGMLKAREQFPATRRDVPSKAVQLFHKKILQVAQDRISTTPVALRDYSTVFFPADPESFSEVKELISKFKRKIARKMATPASKEVYVCAIQLFPLSQSN